MMAFRSGVCWWFRLRVMRSGRQIRTNPHVIKASPPAIRPFAKRISDAPHAHTAVPALQIPICRPGSRRCVVDGAPPLRRQTGQSYTVAHALRHVREGGPHGIHGPHLIAPGCMRCIRLHWNIVESVIAKSRRRHRAWSAPGWHLRAALMMSLQMLLISRISGTTRPPACGLYRPRPWHTRAPSHGNAAIQCATQRPQIKATVPPVVPAQTARANHAGQAIAQVLHGLAASPGCTSTDGIGCGAIQLVMA